MITYVHYYFLMNYSSSKLIPKLFQSSKCKQKYLHQKSLFSNCYYYYHYSRTTGTRPTEPFRHSGSSRFNSSSSSSSSSSNRTRSGKKQDDRIISITSLTFDQKWILPCKIHLPPPAVNDNTSSSKSGATETSPILLICGWAGAGTTDWGSIPKMIASKTNRNVITFDSRGMGYSMRKQQTKNENHYKKKVEEEEDYDELSMEIMALDALSVIQHYYHSFSNKEDMNNHNDDDNKNNIQNDYDKNINIDNGINDESQSLIHTLHHQTKTMKFCVGGASMGGLVTQYIAGLLQTISPSNIIHNHQHLLKKHNLHLYQITSIGLICTFMVKKKQLTINNNYYKNNNVSSSILMDQSHFIHSFDQWPSPLHNKNDDKNNQYQCLQEQCVKQFFQAMGQKWLSKPGKKAFQQKLMNNFIQSRNDFHKFSKSKDNGNNSKNSNHEQNKYDYYEWIQKQKDILLDHLHCFYSQDDDDNDDSHHFLDIVRDKEIPYVIVHGEDDSVISVDHAFTIHSILSKKKKKKKYVMENSALDENSSERYSSHDGLIVLKDCDHLCWITHGHEVVDILGDFWSRKELHRLH